MIVVLSRIKHDLHRNALHDFHVVAGGIFRRQQAEARAAGAGDAFDLAVVAASVRVHIDRDALPDLHLPQLRFFEVGGDPDVVKIDDLHQFLTGATFCPTSTVRLLTMPFTGATIFVYCRFNCA